MQQIFWRKTLNSGSVSAYDKLVIPLTRFLEGKWAPAIGKNLLDLTVRGGKGRSVPLRNLVDDTRYLVVPTRRCRILAFPQNIFSLMEHKAIAI